MEFSLLMEMIQKFRLVLAKMTILIIFGVFDHFGRRQSLFGKMTCLRKNENHFFKGWGIFPKWLGWPGEVGWSAQAQAPEGV